MDFARDCASLASSALVLCAALCSSAFAQPALVGSAFTYQGQLKQGGSPYSGTADLQFKLFDSSGGATQIGSTIAVNGITIAGGLFTTPLDFGAAALDGNQRFLEVAVHTPSNGGGGPYTTLTPRQPLTGAPYALGLSLPMTQSVHAPNAAALYIKNDAGTGIRGEANGGSTSGVVGAISDGFGECRLGYTVAGGSTYALFATVGLHGDYAGWFEGPVTVTGSLVTDQLFGAFGRAAFFEGIDISGTVPGQLPLSVTGGSDATLTSGGNIIVGQTSGHNVVFDNNEIMSRNNGIASELYINALGGNVGIGTNAPNATLTVNGTASKPGGGSWSSFSDERLKKNIAPLTDTLQKLLALHGVRFEYIDPASINELPGERIGMVAQDIEKVFPDWIDSGPNGYKRVTYRGFEALTVEALRDLRDQEDREIVELRSENAALRQQIEQMHGENEAINRRLQRIEEALTVTR
jgi:hypothetical protein